MKNQKREFKFQNEIRFCTACNKDTEHFGVIVEPKASKDKKETTKEFISAVIAGWGAGSTAGFLELRELHLICSSCGHKIIEKYRSDLD